MVQMGEDDCKDYWKSGFLSQSLKVITKHGGRMLALVAHYSTRCTSTDVSSAQ